VSRREYGAAGLVGILPPQANTTVEAELGVLLEPDVALLVSRLVCHEQQSRARLLGYFHNVEASLRAFDSAKPDTVLFACTGSTYLTGLEEEQRKLAPLGVISAARAVRDALDALKAKRIALVSPYPPWLTQACVAFWGAQGREVAEVQVPAGEREDTRRIYALGSADALHALERIRPSAVDAVLITGTGMPSLAALAQARLPVPLLSSNLCLAWAAARALKGAAPDRASLEPWLAGDAAWKARLESRFPSLSGAPR
jgi:maleate isomerase